MARKGENIYKRRDGRWEGRFISTYDELGKAKYKYVYAKSYSEIREKLARERASIREVDDNRKNHNQTKFEYCVNEWLTTKKLTVKESTYIRYSNMLENHICPYLGQHYISQIDTDTIERYISKQLTEGRLDNNGGISSKTMSDILVIIKEIFKYAESHGIKTNCNFSRISIKKTSHVMRVFSNAEEHQLIQVLSSDEDRLKLGVFICLCTGIRIGELCALQWKDISFVEKTLRVERTMQRLQFEDKTLAQKTRIIITEPKSFSAIRTIPIPDFLIDRMKSYVESPNTFVLSGKCKRYVEPRTMQNRFKAYLTNGNIEDANFHSLRHTFATRCVEIGFDIKTLSEILGHSSVKITLDKYVHSSMELKRNNMEKLKLILIDF